MKKLILALPFALIPSLAFAQQQQPAPTVQDQLLTICTNVSSSIAKQLDAADVHIAELTKQLAAEKAKTTPKVNK